MEDLGPPDVIYALAASPAFAHDLTCFAAGSGGLIVSDDGGIEWRDAYGSLELEASLTTASVALSPYYETDNSVFAGAIGGILRSYDGGKSWFVTELPTPPPFVTSLLVSPHYEVDGTVFAGTMEDGVFCSRDRGLRWTAWNFGLLDLNVYALAISPHFAEDETLYAGVETGIFRSSNGGRAWREVNFPMEAAPVLSLSVAASTNSVIFAGTENSGLFRSHDEGQTWQQQSAGELKGSIDAIVTEPQGTLQHSILVLNGGQLSVSHDDGKTWSPWTTADGLDDQITAVAAPSGLGPGAPLIVGLAGGAPRKMVARKL